MISLSPSFIAPSLFLLLTHTNIALTSALRSGMLRPKRPGGQRPRRTATVRWGF